MTTTMVEKRSLFHTKPFTMLRNVKNCSHFMRGLVVTSHVPFRSSDGKKQSRMPRTRSAHCRPNTRWQNTRSFSLSRQKRKWWLRFGFFFFLHSNKTPLFAQKGEGVISRQQSASPSSVRIGNVWWWRASNVKCSLQQQAIGMNEIYARLLVVLASIVVAYEPVSAHHKITENNTLHSRNEWRK